MSPEQSGAEGAIDARTDLYAVGIVLFEMFAGRKPFQSENVGEVILMQREAPPPKLRSVAPRGGLFGGAGGAARQGDVEAARGPLPVGGRAGRGAGGDARGARRRAGRWAAWPAARRPTPSRRRGRRPTRRRPTRRRPTRDGQERAREAGRRRPRRCARTRRRRSTPCRRCAGGWKRTRRGAARRQSGSSAWHGSARCSWSSRCWRC